jgi:hypothetical protein
MPDQEAFVRSVHRSFAGAKSGSAGTIEERKAPIARFSPSESRSRRSARRSDRNERADHSTAMVSSRNAVTGERRAVRFQRRAMKDGAAYGCGAAQRRQHSRPVSERLSHSSRLRSRRGRTWQTASLLHCHCTIARRWTSICSSQPQEGARRPGVEGARALHEGAVAGGHQEAARRARGQQHAVARAATRAAFARPAPGQRFPSDVVRVVRRADALPTLPASDPAFRTPLTHVPPVALRTPVTF